VVSVLHAAACGAAGECDLPGEERVEELIWQLGLLASQRVSHCAIPVHETWTVIEQLGGDDAFVHTRQVLICAGSPMG
jgi:hypothetical protein